MIDKILEFAANIDTVLWGVWTMVFIAAIYIYLTAKTGFFQVRKFGFILKNTIGRLKEGQLAENSEKMTPFQATTTALASTVGMGSIAGVATALSVGGPGAIFWMWLLALLGMITKTAEVALAVHYRDTDKQGHSYGGPMYYINKGLGWHSLAKIFSLGMFINAVICATLLQSHTVGRAFLTSYKLNPYVITSIMAVITAIVVIGGIKRIGRFCEKIVPFMSVIYVTGGLIIFVFNYTRIPEVFGTIFQYAFSPAPAAGGFAGASVMAAIKTGMARGMLTNEAGLGTAPMAHATSNTKHPFLQGLWGSFEVFAVTFIICTITAFAVISTGVLASGQSGIELVIAAFASVFPSSLANSLLSFAILTFCLTTQIGFFIYYENSVINLFGKKSIRILKWFYLLPGVIFAGFANVDKLWIFANIAVGVCAIPNLIAVLALSGVFIKLMRDYLDGHNKYATSIIDKNRKYIKKA